MQENSSVRWFTDSILGLCKILVTDDNVAFCLEYLRISVEQITPVYHPLSMVKKYLSEEEN